MTETENRESKAENRSILGLEFCPALRGSATRNLEFGVSTFVVSKGAIRAT